MASSADLAVVLMQQQGLAHVFLVGIWEKGSPYFVLRLMVLLLILILTSFLRMFFVLL